MSVYWTLYIRDKNVTSMVFSTMGNLSVKNLKERLCRYRRLLPHWAVAIPLQAALSGWHRCIGRYTCFFFTIAVSSRYYKFIVGKVSAVKDVGSRAHDATWPFLLYPWCASRQAVSATGKHHRGISEPIPWTPRGGSELYLSDMTNIPKTSFGTWAPASFRALSAHGSKDPPFFPYYVEYQNRFDPLMITKTLASFAGLFNKKSK